jgi:undecaprenyl-diphosphatase
VTVFQAIVLGLVQGLAEFLPISSSAHLALTPYLLGWKDPGLAFDVALHIGTLIALAWYFRKDWIALTQSAWHIVRDRRVEGVNERRVLFLIVATIPGAIAGLLVNDLAETTFRSPALIACTLIVMGILLWAADRYAPRERAESEIGWRDAILIGCAQMFALIPGVSRSGSTITAGRALGLDRVAAARFSFLMSMPITTAAAVLKTPEALAAEGLSAALVAGIIAAGVSSWLAITVLLRFVSRNSFGVFAVYRVLLGLVVLGSLYIWN